MDLSDYNFYHTIDLPGFGTMMGQWDLRPGIDRYLGDVRFGGKRVLDVGCANGFLSFHLERCGAEVVSFDMDENQEWDIVPYSGLNIDKFVADKKDRVRKLNNAYRLARRVDFSVTVV
jgi:hypothetical protein